MPIRIQRAPTRSDTTSPSLWTVLTSGLFARRWIGRAAPALPQLALESQPTLLYFRTRGCTACDLIDMRVGQATHQAGVKLKIIDRHPKSDIPEDLLVYTQPDNILDRGGPINEAYHIGVYPSLVLVDSSGIIVMKDVGVKAPVDTFDQYLAGQFKRLLSQSGPTTA